MRAVRITSDQQIFVGKGAISGWAISAGGDAAKITIYNEGDSSKTAAKQAGCRRAAANNCGSAFPCKPLLLVEGCYAEISGTSAVGFVYVD